MMFFFIEWIKRTVQVLPSYIHQGDIKRKQIKYKNEGKYCTRKKGNKPDNILRICYDSQQLLCQVSDTLVSKHSNFQLKTCFAKILPYAFGKKIVTMAVNNTSENDHDGI